MQDDIQQLRQDLHALRSTFNARLDQLEQRLDQWLPAAASDATPVNTLPQTEPSPGPTIGSLAWRIGRKMAPSPASMVLQPAWLVAHARQRVAAEQPTPITAAARGEPTRSIGAPSAREQAAPPNTPPARSWLRADLVLPLLGPLAGLAEKGLDLYRHYQQRGQVPVFLLTLAGLVALTLGFGYVLQYSFAHFLSPFAKVGLGMLSACAVIVLGGRIYRRRPAMQEYASSLIGLGVVLHYLCAYFAGPYYHLLPDLPGFVYLMLITGAGYWLAARFETRVVAVLTLLGGAATPLVIGYGQASLAVYLYYLMVLVAVAQHLAGLIRWPTLAYTALATAMVMLELLIRRSAEFSELAHTTHIAHWIIALHLLFYVTNRYLLGVVRRGKIAQRSFLFAFMANGAFFIATTYRTLDNDLALCLIWAINALALLGLMLQPQRLVSTRDAQQGLRLLASLYAGTLLAFALLMGLAPAWQGVAWGIEGLLFTWLGLHFHQRAIRVEGYVLVAVGALSGVQESLAWFQAAWIGLPGLFSFTFSSGWIALVILGAQLIALGWLLWRWHQSTEHDEGEAGDARLSPAENRLVQALIVAVGLWSLLFHLATLGMIASELPWIGAGGWVFLLLWAGRKSGAWRLEQIGLWGLALLAVPSLANGAATGDWGFTGQPWVVQVTRIELFVLLWAVAAWYRHCHAHSPLFRHAQRLHQVFLVLIPVIVLPIVLRKAPDWFPVVMWVSALVSAGLLQWTRERLLVIETRILAAGAMLIALISAALVELAGWQGKALISLLSGLGLCAASVAYYQLWLRTPDLSEARHFNRTALTWVWQLVCYFPGLVLFCLSYGWLGDAGTALGLSGLYYAGLFSYRPTLGILRSRLQPAYLLTGLLAVLTLAALHWTWLLNRAHAPTPTLTIVVALTLLAAVLALTHRRHPARARIQRRLGGSVLHLWISHALLWWGYCLAAAELFPGNTQVMITLLMVAHGTALLFAALRPRWQALTRLAALVFGLAAFKVLLFDMAGFSMLQKMIAFLLMGGLLLASAYGYQRLRPVDGAQL